MKKNLLELSIGEFVRVLCDMPEEYAFSVIDSETELNKIELKGTYNELHKTLLMLSGKNPDADQIMEYVEKNLFDYNISLDKMDIYDYLEYRTMGFQKERCKIILSEMEIFHSVYVDEERLAHVNSMINKGWDEYKIIEKPYLLKEDEIKKTIDYKDAYEKIYGIAYDFCYCEAIAFLKSKIGCLDSRPKHPSEPTNTCILPDRLIDEAIDAKLIERTGNGLKWIQTASLYGYFIDKVSDKLNLKSSSNRVQWRNFRFIVNHESLLQSAKQAVNDYKNKSINPPEGDDIVNRLLK